MKVCLLGDTHFGIRDGSKIMHDFFELTYTDWFFDLLKEHGVDEIYQFGDLFDKRKGVDSYSIAESKRYFFNKLVEYDITMHVLVGNHDAYFKESIIINSPDQLLGNYKNIIVYDKPTTVLIGHISVDIIPWICRDNYEEVKEFVNNSHSEFCFGHFEFEGFSMYKGVMSHGGLSTAMFKKYRHVYSGHFHTRSTGGNITYLGTPCEMTWNDFNDPRGIHFFDMDNGSVTFEENPHTLFLKIEYNEDVPDTDKLEAADAEFVRHKFIKLLVTKRVDFKRFDKFMAKLIEASPHEVKLIEDLSDFNETNVEGENMEFDDTPTLLDNYINEIDTDLDKDRLKREMRLLYVEAQASL